MISSSIRTSYSGTKYAALHLLLARWLRRHAARSGYHYITLGGTELKDAVSLSFIDPQLMADATSCEADADRYALAVERAASLVISGVGVKVTQGSIFDFTRGSDDPHIFFYDFEGRAYGPAEQDGFERAFAGETIRTGDLLIVTSYVGPHPQPWASIRQDMEGIWAMFRITGRKEKQAFFNANHPTITLYRALKGANALADVNLKCFGNIIYMGRRAHMGLFGYLVTEGKTELRSLISDTDAKILDGRQLWKAAD